MTIDAEAAAASWLSRNALIVTIVVAVILAAGVAFYALYVHPQNQQHDLAARKGEAAIAQGAQQSGHDAIRTIQGNHAHEQAIDQQTRTNYVYITKAAGAGDPVNPAVDAAGRHAICLRSSAAGLSECQRLLKPNP